MSEVDGVGDVDVPVDGDQLGVTQPDSVSGPTQIAPDVHARDFVNGQGALGVRIDPDQWSRNLGDQGIANQVQDGRVSVFKTLQPDGSYGVVGIDDYVPGQTNGQPSGWRQYPPPANHDQNLGDPIYQDLDAYKHALLPSNKSVGSTDLGQVRINSHARGDAAEG